MPGEPIAERRVLAAGASALLHLAAFALLLLWPTGRPVDPPREALTTIAFPTPTPDPSADPPPQPATRAESSRPTRDAGAPGVLATPVPTLAAALPVAQPSIAPELGLADGSDARLGAGAVGPGRGANGVGDGSGGGGRGGNGTGDGGSDPEWIAGAIRNSDYPRLARKTGAEGKVETEIAVDANGRPSRCTVVGSSGSPVLDQATCRLVMRRFRFVPARDRAGRPVAGTIFYDQEWFFRSAAAE